MTHTLHLDVYESLEDRSYHIHDFSNPHNPEQAVELLFSQPYVKIKFLVDAGIAERQAASEYLQELEKLGILKSERRGREVIYRHLALLEVLRA